MRQGGWTSGRMSGSRWGFQQAVLTQFNWNSKGLPSQNEEEMELHSPPPNLQGCQGNYYQVLNRTGRKGETKTCPSEVAMGSLHWKVTAWSITREDQGFALGQGVEHENQGFRVVFVKECLSVMEFGDARVTSCNKLQYQISSPPPPLCD